MKISESKYSTELIAFPSSFSFPVASHFPARTTLNFHFQFYCTFTHSHLVSNWRHQGPIHNQPPAHPDIMYKKAEHINLASLIRNESYLCTVSFCHRIDILVFFRNENTECLRIHCWLLLLKIPKSCFHFCLDVICWVVEAVGRGRRGISLEKISWNSR